MCKIFGPEENWNIQMLSNQSNQSNLAQLMNAKQDKPTQLTKQKGAQRRGSKVTSKKLFQQK